MLTAVCRGALASVVPRWDTIRSTTTLALAATARTKRSLSPLGSRSIVVMPFPASAGALNDNEYDRPPGAVSVTGALLHWCQPSTSLVSCDWAAGGSRNAVAAWVTWIDLSRVRVSEYSSARYLRMALTV